MWVQEEIIGGFPGGAVVASPPADAGHTGSCPGPGTGKIPHAAERLGPWAMVAEPVRPEPVAPQRERPQQWEAREP